MTMHRRTFLSGAATLGAATLLGACADDGSSDGVAGSTSTTAAAPGTSLGGTPAGALVLVTLDGGNDALSTVAPITDDRYHAQRGALALDPDATHDVGEGFGLHPALERCKTLFDADQLAIVHGVGFEGLDRSHFHCRDVWYSGRADDLSSGWLGRWLELTDGDLLSLIGVGGDLPLVLRGERRSGAVVPAGPFALPGGDRLEAALRTMAAPDPTRGAVAASVAGTASDLLAVADRVGPVLEGLDEPDVGSGRAGLRAQLDVVALLLESELPTRAFSVQLGGFDTHAAQAPTHDRLLAELDGALGSFLDRTATLRVPVTVAVMSEFGRRVAPNASAGTDHGTAGTVLVAGAVRGGHRGDPPPLDRLVDGDLATTTDLHRVLGGLLEGVLGVDATDVLGPGPAALELT